MINDEGRSRSLTRVGGGRRGCDDGGGRLSRAGRDDRGLVVGSGIRSGDSGRCHRLSVVIVVTEDWVKDAGHDDLCVYRGTVQANKWLM